MGDMPRRLLLCYERHCWNPTSGSISGSICVTSHHCSHLPRNNHTIVHTVGVSVPPPETLCSHLVSISSHLLFTLSMSTCHSVMLGSMPIVCSHPLGVVHTLVHTVGDSDPPPGTLYRLVLHSHKLAIHCQSLTLSFPTTGHLVTLRVV